MTMVMMSCFIIIIIIIIIIIRNVYSAIMPLGGYSGMIVLKRLKCLRFLSSRTH